MDAVPEHEYERRRRAGVLRGHSVDSTRPPTHLRRECLLAGGSVPAAVAVDGDRERRIAAELADARGAVARRIIRDGFEGQDPGRVAAGMGERVVRGVRGLRR